jgi:hypothetical protein
MCHDAVPLSIHNASWRLLLILGLAVGGGCKHASTGAAPAGTQAGSSPPTLAVLAGAAYAYELSLEQRRDPERDQPSDPLPWRFQVRLVQAGKVLDQASPFAMACGEAEPSRVQRVLGADPEATAWGTSAEHCDVVLAVRSLELAPGVIALLASQRLGYESVYSEHWLLRPINGRLEVVWESRGGPDYFTGVRALPGDAPHRNDLAMIEIFNPSDGEATSIKAVRRVFDLASGEARTSSLPDARSPLFLVTVGPFPTAKAAQEAWIADRDCLFSYRVFKASLLPGLRARNYLLGLVMARREDATTAASELTRCSRVSKASVLEYTADR